MMQNRKNEATVLQEIKLLATPHNFNTVLSVISHSNIYNSAQFGIMYLALMCLDSLMQELLWPLVLSFSLPPTERKK